MLYVFEHVIDLSRARCVPIDTRAATAARLQKTEPKNEDFTLLLRKIQ